MKQLTKEEEAENDRIEKEKQKKLQSNYNTQSILIQDNKDHLLQTEPRTSQLQQQAAGPKSSLAKSNTLHAAQINGSQQPRP